MKQPIRISSSKTIYVDAPVYTQTSNGIKCLYYLAEELKRRGALVRFLPRNLRSFTSHLPSRFSHIRHTPYWFLEPNSILICSESTPRHVINSARKKGLLIFWWYLAPLGLLEKARVKPLETDQLLIFSSYVLPDHKGKYSYYQPEIDLYWRQSLKKYCTLKGEVDLKVVIYCGKGRLKSLPNELLAILSTSKIQIISRDWPSSREKLMSILQSSDALVSFDEMSQISLETASLGIPVFLANPIFPLISIEKFSIDIRKNIITEAKTFLNRLDSLRINRRNSLRESCLYQANQYTVDHIARLINCTGTSDYTKTLIGNRYTIKQLKHHSNYLRRKRVLLPILNGQSPGSLLMDLYVRSIAMKPFMHQAISHLIRLVDYTYYIFATIRMQRLLLLIINMVWYFYRLLKKAIKKLT